MPKTEFTKINIQTPVSVLVHGANLLGYMISKALLEQGSKVIIIDEYTAVSKKYISELKKIGDADFIQYSGAEAFFNVINRVDYLFYFQSELLNQTENFTSKEFLDESNLLNACLKTTVQFNTKFSLVTTIEHNKKLALAGTNQRYSAPTPYSNTEMQKYAETLTAEYHDKSKANVRIIRLGEILGEGFALEYNKQLSEIFNEAVKSTTLSIRGDGLDTHYLIHATDAIFGILKLTFSEKTKGEVISLSNKNEYTTLSIAYKILESNATATEIKFIPEVDKKQIIQIQYIPAKNASEFGWAQDIPIEQSIIETIDSIYRKYNRSWVNKPNNQDQLEKKIAEIKSASNSSGKKQSQTSSISQHSRHTQTVKTPLGKFLSTLATPFVAIGRFFKKIFSFFNKSNLKVIAISTSVLLLLYIFILGPIISIFASGIFAYNEVKSAISDLSQFNFSSATNRLERIVNYSNHASQSIQNIKWIFSATNQNDFYDNLYQLSYSAKYAAEGAYGTIKSLEPLGKYLQNFEPAINLESSTPTNTREYREELTALANNREQITKSTNDIIIATQLLESIDSTAFPEFMQSYVTEIKSYGREVEKLVDPAQKFVIFLPDMLGLNERKTYLIVLQNPSELRSTGGWISSYALLGLEGGQVRQLAVDDVYNLDGDMLTAGKIEPAPKSMQDSLGIKYWNFSLSNWNPNFEQTQVDMENFLLLSGKAADIDGIITLDVTLIQKLLKAWDGLEVAGEVEKVTADNMYDKIFQMHTDFIPGQSQKSDFLKNLANAVINKIISSEYDDFLTVANVILDSLDSKNIIVYLDNQNANKYFSNKGWSGIIDDRYSSAPVAVDWNWGANKSNLYLKRNVDLFAEIVSDKEIRYTYNLTVQNNSENSSYPQGDYKNLFRLYLPDNAQITSVKGFLDENYRTDRENGMQLISGWFNVPIKTTKTVTLTYTVLRSDSDLASFPLVISGINAQLDLNMYKQPGNMNETVNISVTYPELWNIMKYDGFNRSGNKLELQKEFNTDMEYLVTWELR